MKVHYPLGGRGLLLHWSTDGMRGHVVLAGSDRGIFAAARHIFDEDATAEIRSVHEVEIVGPSRQIAALADAREHRGRVTAFHHEIVYRMRDVLMAGRTLPVPFSMCDRYEGDVDDVLPASPARVGERLGALEHHECRRCVYGIRMEMTPEELYERHHARWVAAERSRPSPAPDTRQASRATPAEDGEPLWCAYEDFGHHRQGVVLEAVDLTAKAGEDPVLYSDRVMFFFRRGREDVELMRVLAAMQATKKAELVEYAAQRQRLYRAERDERERAAAEVTIAFFGGAS